MASRFAGMLREYRRQTEAFGSDLVFPSARGGPLVARRWAKGKDNSPHRLRDTWISAAREIGIGQLEVKVVVGHTCASADVTDGYTLFSLVHLRACVEKVAEFLVGKMPALIALH